MSNCSTLRLDECRTYTRLCKQVVAGVVNMKKRGLSAEARHPKQLRRRLEHRYRRTGFPSDKQACAARDSILRSRDDRIKSELDEVS